MFKLIKLHSLDVKYVNIELDCPNGRIVSGSGRCIASGAAAALPRGSSDSLATFPPTNDSVVQPVQFTGARVSITPPLSCTPPAHANQTTCPGVLTLL